MPDDRPEQFVERRKNRRREEDVVVDHAVKDAPLVHRLLQTGKVAGAVAVIFALLGGVGGAIGMKLVGPTASIAAEGAARARADSIIHDRIDMNAGSIQTLKRSTDSLVQIMIDVRGELRLNSYAQCAMMRKLAPELRAPGCDAATRQGGGPNNNSPNP